MGTSNTTFSSAATALVKSYEDFSTIAYPDTASALGIRLREKGIPLTQYTRLEGWEDISGHPFTIGWGSTRYADGTTVKAGDRVTIQEADALLSATMQKMLDAAMKYVKVKLNQNQIDAITSFVYNVGVGKFSRSTLLRRINEQNIAAAGEQFKRWRFAGGVEFAGLVKRRAAERKLFLTK